RRGNIGRIIGPAARENDQRNIAKRVRVTLRFGIGLRRNLGEIVVALRKKLRLDSCPQSGALCVRWQFVERGVDGCLADDLFDEVLGSLQLGRGQRVFWSYCCSWR